MMEMLEPARPVFCDNIVLWRPMDASRRSDDAYVAEERVHNVVRRVLRGMGLDHFNVSLLNRGICKAFDIISWDEHVRFAEVSGDDIVSYVPGYVSFKISMSNEDFLVEI